MLRELPESEGERDYRAGCLRTGGRKGRRRTGKKEVTATNKRGETRSPEMVITP
jgi:hypothetical protein